MGEELALTVIDETSTSMELHVSSQGNKNISVFEAEVSELLGTTAENEEKAYELYNDYAFSMGFSIRRSRQRNKASEDGITMKQYCCSKEGRKSYKAKCYTKQDTRTNCKAKITCFIDDQGVYTIRKHDMEHNHNLCPQDKLHLLRSQRNIKDQDIDFLLQLVNSGVKLSDAIRVISKEKGGLSAMGFTPRDAYNVISREKKTFLEGSDAHSFIQMLNLRRQQDPDFFYEYELDESGSLTNVFWCDGQMKKDYIIFGDCVVHDTTYRTNRYDMICAPFVGMNHHGRNVMFGCGFLTDEKTESFIWLFNTFLKVMKDKQPVTIMTDQSAAMAAAIRVVFKKSHHRLCVWHLSENSKKHIRHLRALKGFVEIFDLLLKYVDTPAEFYFYWNRLANDYMCTDNVWLQRLYKCKEKWCPAFSKEYFSGGILSSQRSETTNDSISRRLRATAGLCDFYSCFVDVISDWRNNQLNDDFRCLQGNPEMIANHVNMLSHARQVYTTEIYHMFEEQFLQSMTLHQHLQDTKVNYFVYHVGKASKDQTQDLIKHVVTFNLKEMSISCTCKMYTQVGILCSHCLRIMNIHCIDDIPHHYILKRWTKEATTMMGSDAQKINSTKEHVSASVWRAQMTRKFNDLISFAHANSQSRYHLEEAYNKTKQLVYEESQRNCVSPDFEQERNEVRTSSKIGNPPKSRAQGERNKRRKSTFEKIRNMVRGRKAKTFRAANHAKKSAQTSVKETVKTMVGDGYLVHPPNGGPLLMSFVTPDQSPTVLPQNFSDQMSTQSASSSRQPCNMFMPTPDFSRSGGYMLHKDSTLATEHPGNQMSNNRIFVDLNL